MKRLLSSVVVAFAFAFAVPALAADAPAAPVTIKPPEGNKQGAVTFDHKQHAKVDCKKCHADAANAKVVPAIKEHKAADSKGPAHDLCVNCHKENKAKSGCTNCHAKKT